MGTPDLAAVQAAVDAARDAARDGKPAVSVRHYRRVLRQLETPASVDDSSLLRVRARAMLGLAMSLYETTGDLGAGLADVDAVERLIADEPDLVCAARGQRGLLLLRNGEVTASLAALDQAAELIEYAEPLDQMSILLNRGVLHLEVRDLDSAAEDLERCRQIAARVGAPAMEVKATHNLGYVDFLAGRIPRALAVLDRALKLNPQEPPHPVAHLDRARVFREAGLIAEADAELEKASARFREQRLLQDLGEAELVRAECALMEGDARRARAFARAALRRFTQRDNLRWLRQAELLLLHCDRRLADDKRPAVRGQALLQLAFRAAELSSDCVAEGRADLARAADLVAAEALLRVGQPIDGVPRPTLTDTLPLRLQAYEVRALAALQAGDRSRAAAEVRRGLAELGSHQNRFGSLDLRTAGAVHGIALSKLQLDVAMADGRPSTVFAGIERARAVSTRLAHVRPPSDERTAELLAALRQVEEQARGLAGASGAAELLAQLRSRAAQLQRDIRARAWELEGVDEEPVQASARLSQVRAAAGDQAFASYARYHGRWIAVVAAGRRVELLELAGVAEVDELVRRVRADLDAVAMPRLPEPILRAVRSSIARTLRQLDELLLTPLRVEGRPLVVSCSGSLAVLPWSLLPSREGLSVVVTPSATSWLRAQEGPQRQLKSTPPRAVAIGGPDLHLAAAEAKGVAAVWTGSRLLTEAAATVTATHEALRDAEVVHIAAHGTHQQESPLFSSIRLADGQLYAYELDAEARIAPFVALSACEAGLATVRPGDEGLGLTNVLLQLGSYSVVAAVARVRDDVAAEVMQRVHHGMARGRNSADALAVAQADCADAEVPVPFLCFGSSW